MPLSETPPIPSDYAVKRSMDNPHRSTNNKASGVKQKFDSFDFSDIASYHTTDDQTDHTSVLSVLLSTDIVNDRKNDKKNRQDNNDNNNHNDDNVETRGGGGGRGSRLSVVGMRDTFEKIRQQNEYEPPIQAPPKAKIIGKSKKKPTTQPTVTESRSKNKKKPERSRDKQHRKNENNDSQRKSRKKSRYRDRDRHKDDRDETTQQQKDKKRTPRKDTTTTANHKPAIDKNKLPKPNEVTPNNNDRKENVTKKEKDKRARNKDTKQVVNDWNNRDIMEYTVARHNYKSNKGDNTKSNTNGNDTDTVSFMMNKLTSVKKQQFEDLYDRYKNVQNENKRLQQELNSIQNEKLEWDTTKTTLMSTIKKQTSAIEELQDQVFKWETKYKQENVHASELESKYSDQMHELANAKQQLQSDLIKANDKIFDLQQDLKKVRRTSLSRHFETKLEQSRVQSRVQSQSQSIIQTRNSTQEFERIQQQKEKQAEKEKQTEMNQLLQQKQTQIESLIKELNLKNDKITHITKDCSELSAEKFADTMKIEKLERDCIQYQQNISNIQIELKKLQETTQKQQSQAKNEEMLLTELLEKDHQIEQLTKDMNSLQRELRNIRKQCDDKSKDNMELKSTMKRMSMMTMMGNHVNMNDNDNCASDILNQLDNDTKNELEANKLLLNKIDDLNWKCRKYHSTIINMKDEILGFKQSTQSWLNGIKSTVQLKSDKFEVETDRAALNVRESTVLLMNQMTSKSQMLVQKELEEIARQLDESKKHVAQQTDQQMLHVNVQHKRNSTSTGIQATPPRPIMTKQSIDDPQSPKQIPSTKSQSSTKSKQSKTSKKSTKSAKQKDKSSNPSFFSELNKIKSSLDENELLSPKTEPTPELQARQQHVQASSSSNKKTLKQRQFLNVSDNDTKSSNENRSTDTVQDEEIPHEKKPKQSAFATAVNGLDGLMSDMQKWEIPKSISLENNDNSHNRNSFNNNNNNNHINHIHHSHQTKEISTGLRRIDSSESVASLASNLSVQSNLAKNIHKHQTSPNANIHNKHQQKRLKSPMNRILTSQEIKQLDLNERGLIESPERDVDGFGFNAEQREIIQSLQNQMTDLTSKIDQRDEMITRLSDENKFYQNKILELRNELTNNNDWNEKRLSNAYHETQRYLKLLESERDVHTNQMQKFEQRFMLMATQNQELMQLFDTLKQNDNVAVHNTIEAITNSVKNNTNYNDNRLNSNVNINSNNANSIDSQLQSDYFTSNLYIDTTVGDDTPNRRRVSHHDDQHHSHQHQYTVQQIQRQIASQLQQAQDAASQARSLSRNQTQEFERERNINRHKKNDNHHYSGGSHHINSNKQKHVHNGHNKVKNQIPKPDRHRRSSRNSGSLSNRNHSTRNNRSNRQDNGYRNSPQTQIHRGQLKVEVTQMRQKTFSEMFLEQLNDHFDSD